MGDSEQPALPSIMTAIPGSKSKELIERYRNIFGERGVPSARSWPYPEFQVWIVAALRNHKEGTETSECSRLENLRFEVKEHQKGLLRNREALFGLFFQSNK